MLDSIFNHSVATIDISMILIASLVSIVLGIVIALTHRYTSTYNKNFLITLTLLPFLVQSIIIVVNGNLGMGLVVAGTFSLIRFRSATGTSREILSVFFAVAIGLANGMGYIVYSTILTVIGCLIILLLNLLPLFNEDKCQKNLKITIPEDLDYGDVFDDILKKYTRSYRLVSVKSTALGSLFELKYSLLLKRDINEKELIDEIRVKNGNLKVILTQYLDSSEL